MLRINLLAGLLFCQSALAQALSSFEAHYTAFRSGMELGHATQRLSHSKDGLYTLHFSSSASFLFLSDKRRETSEFRFEKGEFIPQQYAYQRSGTGKDRQTDIRFSSQNNEIIVNQDKHLPWSEETDNQLFHLDIRRRLAAGENHFHYQTINERGKKDEEIFAVMGEERLTLPIGELDTIKLQKVRKDSPRETYIWLAPQLDHQMVRLRQLKDGDEQLDIQLSAYTTDVSPTAND
ncbi:DUF3108 domain-containing protein [Lacimicrobium sp. SS2-24]|uniref:DUF3108 domain-containing protein n=1 Tax=Lacimicrobium sp. SS2-24 TaxID=2005569 RepID=UPI001438FECC|nr:DUF3108 domain-containing protein [Lacimicrobium sp. SS2-24]